jgi:hypothetical protein
MLINNVGQENNSLVEQTPQSEQEADEASLFQISTLFMKIIQENRTKFFLHTAAVKLCSLISPSEEIFK